MAVFAIAGNPNKPTMFPTSRPGVLHGNDVIYGGWCLYYLRPDLTFGYQLKEVTGIIQWTIFGGGRVEARSTIALVFRQLSWKCGLSDIALQWRNGMCIVSDIIGGFVKYGNAQFFIHCLLTHL